MVTAIKQIGTVGKDGKIELYTPELIEGTKVEVILLVDHQDETEYLLSNAANAKRLFEAIANVEKGEGLVTFSAEEWHEKYSI
jgi:antitoxin YefM